ncbi:hypothetical protein P4S64_06100 [Vibrio sp. M60_M31a]
MLTQTLDWLPDIETDKAKSTDISDEPPAEPISKQKVEHEFRIEQAQVQPQKKPNVVATADLLSSYIVSVGVLLFTNPRVNSVR